MNGRNLGLAFNNHKGRLKTALQNLQAFHTRQHLIVQRRIRRIRQRALIAVEIRQNAATGKTIR